MQLTAAGLWPIQPLPNFIEDVFSCFLYTGNSTSQTITNNIDLSTKGGLVWFKNRTAGSTGQMWYDTARGAYKYLQSDSTGAEANGSPDGLSAFTASGFSLNGASDYWNLSANNYVSWTFREQPKFFDIVTYTGTSTVQNIAHNLGSTPGCIIIKRTNSTSNWAVYHRGTNGGTNPQNYFTLLSTTDAQSSATSYWDNTAPTSTQFTVGGGGIGNVNYAGSTYVAYLFAHDAGGFGLTGTDNVISCGSYVGDGLNPGPTITLGYEPQWVMIKRATGSAGDWMIMDSMRDLAVNGNNKLALRPNLSDAETGRTNIAINATGFVIASSGTIGNASGDTYIYIAIRRGPMKVPTAGTSVFATVARTGTGAAATVTAGFPVDMYLMQRRPNHFPNIVDRLRGNTKNIQTYQTDAEATNSNTITGFDNMTAVPVGADTDGYVNQSAITYVNQMFRRAPSFMDVVCYTGTGTYGAANHNLGVTPELVIYKSRSNAVDWGVIKTVSSIAYYTGLLNTTDPFTYYSNDPSVAGLYTSTQFCKYQDTSAYTYVAYLFATCAGVSKVGSYTGTAATLQIDCGFTAGARFVLIKRTDSTGAWYVWDTARGIIAGNDPYLLLNSTAAEVTSTDYIDTYNAGFEISSTAPAAINASGGTYIFLAIA
jgi:hypothetical protein